MSLRCAGELTNTATVAGGGDVNAANNTATDATTIGAGPDLTITKTHTGNFTQGQTGATYTISVTNAGNTPTSGTVTVTDALPAGLTATGLERSGLDLHAGAADVHPQRRPGRCAAPALSRPAR